MPIGSSCPYNQLIFAMNWTLNLDQIVSQVLRSSAFEGMLLKATWPGNEAVPQSLLDEIIKHSIPAFKYGRAVS